MIKSSQKMIAGLAIVLATQSNAQEPLSAIDWLSNSIREPDIETQQDQGTLGTDALSEISVTAIAQTNIDAVGLYPASLAGLPKNMWRASNADVIASRLGALQTDLLPTIQDLLYAILLAELEPPQKTGREPTLFLARIDTLLAMGALEQASALISRSGHNSPEVFRRDFDIALLLHREGASCDELNNTPALAPSFPARVYCLAKSGDWAGAALTLETGKALGFVNDEDDALLARFLELGLDDIDAPLSIPRRPSPLEFRIYEAVGRPLSTTDLPRAFAHSDLHSSSGWKTQLEAAERLVRSGAIDGNLLFGLYSERQPAASGGVWDRAQAIQTLDGAILARNRTAIEASFAQAFALMKAAELERPFAKAYCRPLRELDQSALSNTGLGKACLLANEQTISALPSENTGETLRFAQLLAQKAPLDEAAASLGPTEKAIAKGFANNGAPARLFELEANQRIGEALLRAIELFNQGATGDTDDLTDAIQYFRHIGLEDIARQACIELLLLERVG